MKLPFEQWLDEHDLPDEATVPFSESILAFKIGAYRAALMFSYIGMGLCLRRRLLAATMPAGVPEGQWTSIQRDLQDEHQWDDKVFECTQMKPPKFIFDVDDHLREEMKYWKNRRNDCAHFKRNEIAAPHVESFWLYLKSNLGRWVPNGSKNDVLDRIVKHFDPNLTQPGADIMPIAKMIPQAVAQPGLATFFDEIVQRLTRTAGTFTMPETKNVTAVFVAILDAGHPVVASAASSWLHQHPDLLVELLRRAPHHAGILKNQPALVRNLWRTKFFRNGHPDLAIFASLVRLSLIPSNEMQEAVSWCVDRLQGDIPSDEDERTLASAGFWDAFHRKAIGDDFGINDFDWGNRNALLIAWRIQRHPLDADTARAICTTFAKPPFPYDVRKALKKMLAANPLKMTELSTLAAQGKTSVPNTLTPDDETTDDT